MGSRLGLDGRQEVLLQYTLFKQEPLGDLSVRHDFDRLTVREPSEEVVHLYGLPIRPGFDALAVELAIDILAPFDFDTRWAKNATFAMQLTRAIARDLTDAAVWEVALELTLQQICGERGLFTQFTALQIARPDALEFPPAVARFLTDAPVGMVLDGVAVKQTLDEFSASGHLAVRVEIGALAMLNARLEQLLGDLTAASTGRKKDRRPVPQSSLVGDGGLRLTFSERLHFPVQLALDELALKRCQASLPRFKLSMEDAVFELGSMAELPPVVK